MNLELTTRLLVAAAVIGSGLLLYWLVNWFSLRNAVVKVSRLQDYQTGHPAILYFTTPGCTLCKTVQGPVIDSLKERLDGSLQVFEFDATVRPDLADAWGVMTVPTTFVIDARGKLRHVNHGVATTEKLFSQLRGFIQ